MMPVIILLRHISSYQCPLRILKNFDLIKSCIETLFASVGAEIGCLIGIAVLPITGTAVGGFIELLWDTLLGHRWRNAYFNSFSSEE
jgi:hypothetical protein